MAFLMFTTSVGFAVDIHYCQGQLKSISFLGKAKSCHEMSDATQMKNCPQHKKMLEQNKNCSLDNKDCCGNKTFHFQSDQDKVVQTYDFAVNKQLQQFVAVYVLVFFSNNLVETDTSPFNSYKPPLVFEDILVLIQSFLL